MSRERSISEPPRRVAARTGPVTSRAGCSCCYLQRRYQPVIARSAAEILAILQCHWRADWGDLVIARLKFALAAEEAEELSRRARATTVSVRDRRRAEIIVLSAQGLTEQRIAEQLGISRVAVNRWVGRFALHRLDGLSDRAGRGRKPWLPQTAVEQAVTPPPHLGRWSCRTMARAAGVSPASVSAPVGGQ